MTMTSEERKEKKERAEAMAMKLLANTFSDFEAEYRKAASKNHLVVMAQAQQKVAEKWKSAIRMSLICLASTDDAIAEYEEERALNEQSGK